MLGINKGDMLEFCVCNNCGSNEHPCGGPECAHIFAFALEDETNEGVKAQFKDWVKVVPTHNVVAYAWGGWVPEEIEEQYEEFYSKMEYDSPEWVR